MVSLYLEFYHGKSINPDGKIKYIRNHEFLKMYLYHKPKTASDKEHNKKIMLIAKNIKNQRELEMLSNRFGFQTETKNTNFFEYYYHITQKKLNTPGYGVWQSSIKVFKDFAGKNITFAEITEKFCEKFLYHLQNRVAPQGNKLNNSTINHHFQRFSYVINRAIEDKIIVENPLLKIKPLKVKKTEKVYLTLEELKLLLHTDCKDKELKRAFLFCCLTGLRWSDVYKLSWSEVKENQGKFSITYRQKKTEGLNYLPLSEQAVSYLGERGNDKDKVFRLPSYDVVITRQLQQWCKDAGVSKKITFHSSRHTFAVLQLSYGTNIFVVQKLLGHSSIVSTQVYANIVDSEKERAMNVIPNISPKFP
jgi:integrase